MFRILSGGADFREFGLLRDGETVLLRRATPADVPAVEELMRRVSRESLRMRFMGAVSSVSRGTVEFMCGGEPEDRCSLLAIASHDADARVVGMGGYVASGVGRRAEVAFLVLDEYQGRGVSTLILERLAGIAAGRGFTGFEAEVLSDNQAMIGVFRDSGFEVHQAAVEYGSVHLEFPIGGMASVRERAELRERIAAANSLVPLLQPRAVAVVGASRDSEAVGSMIFRAILRGNFAGTAFPVNREAGAVHGVRAWASLRELPEPPELVVIAVPSAGVLEVAEEALQSGARGLLVVTSGFAESGPDGARLQDELVELARSRGARLIGPNCLGLMNTHPDVRLNASLAPSMAPRGRIGFFSHSAALGIVILQYAEERGLGFSTFVSAGNRADVSGNDLLQFWEEDPSTDIALLYLETFGDPRRFARIARRLAYRKAVLCVKSARSRAGHDLARAHIGAVARNETNVETLFRQAGVIRADTLEEMFDVAALLASQPLPRGERVAIVSNSGGVLTICADACEAQGLVIAGPGVVDLGPLATETAYEDAVARAAAHPDVDALIAIFAGVGECDPQRMGRAIRRGVLEGERLSGVSKPALLCLMGAARTVEVEVAREGEDDAARREFPSYRFPESAARALGRAAQYAAFRRRPAGRLVWYDDADAPAARRSAAALRESAAGGALWLEGEAAAGIFASFGILSGEGETLPAEAGDAVVEMLPDRSFGPLVRVRRGSGVSAVRITPLTDRDVDEILAAARLPAGRGLEELFGRISQMIEELPWLCGIEAEFHLAAPGSKEGKARLGPRARIGFFTDRIDSNGSAGTGAEAL